MQTVSLILPVYNPNVEWLDVCLASIKAQTYEKIELIRVDDAGTGAAAARNRGLLRATGDLIAFCDCDDYLEPDAIEKMVKAMDGVEMVCGSFRKFGNFEMTVRHSTQTLPIGHVAGYAFANMQHPMQNQMLSGCWAKLYRRGYATRFPELITAEDMAFNFDYLKRCDDVRFINEIVYHHRKHSNSLTTTFDPNHRLGLFDFMEGLKYVKRFLLDFYSEEQVEDALDNSKAYHSMLYASRIGPDALKKVFA